MSRRSRTGEVDPIPAPDTERPAPAVSPRPGFDFGDIDAAIGDLTADVQAGPVQAVELATAVPTTDPDGALAELVGMAELDDDLKFTDEHLPVPEPLPETGSEPPAAFAAGPPPAMSGPPPAMSAPPPYAQASAPPPYAQASAPPPYAQPSAPPYAQPSAPPPYGQPSAPPPADPYAQPSAPPPDDPFEGADPSSPGAPPVGRRIQNVETAYVRNPLLAPRAAAPAPAASHPPPDPYGATAGQPEVGSPPRGSLVVNGGDWNGTTWYLNRAETRLGRGEENDIVVLDIGVSRHHLVLLRHVEGFRLVDLQSGNGTYVNGRRATEIELYDGDRIDLGHTSLIFATVGGTRPRPPGTAEHTVGRQLPTSWLVLMALTTFFTVLGTMYLVRSLKGDDGPPAALAAAREAIGEQDWAGARAALEAARNDGAGEDELAPLEARIESEEAAARKLQKARGLVEGALSEDDARALPETLEAILRSVPPTSGYYGETLTLMQRARQLRINALLDEAERLLAEGKSVLARVKVRTALKEDPGNARAKAVRRKLDEL